MVLLRQLRFVNKGAGAPGRAFRWYEREDVLRGFASGACARIRRRTEN